jgi:phenylalanyl-tRNA synthetase alpha chain
MYMLTEEGKEYLKEGLPEKRLIKFLEKKEARLSDLNALPYAGIGINWAKRNGWIALKAGGAELTKKGKEALQGRSETDVALEAAAKGEKLDALTAKMLIGRGLIIEERTAKKETLLEEIKEKLIKEKEIKALTSDVIRSHAWKHVPFRKYDVGTPAPKIFPGKPHPYVQFLNMTRKKMADRGYKETEGPMVEMQFWNCDALFMPQDHPARGIHDVFFLNNPKSGSVKDKTLVDNLRKAHEGKLMEESRGWGGKWDVNFALRSILRSQNTAASARTLYTNGDKPGKFFCLGRTFRHDIIDYKHLIEFYQCDGIIIGENLNFRQQLSHLREILEMMGGSAEVKFKPAYFPFTEPSVEGYVKHPKLGWIEALGAGMFRPEVCKALGLGKAQVLAWATGLDRLFQIKYGVEDIRMLYSEDIGFLREAVV